MPPAGTDRAPPVGRLGGAYFFGVLDRTYITNAHSSYCIFAANRQQYFCAAEQRMMIPQVAFS
jgi:hypothetical protein